MSYGCARTFRFYPNSRRKLTFINLLLILKRWKYFKNYVLLSTLISICVPYHFQYLLSWQSCCEKHCAICHFLHSLLQSSLSQLHIHVSAVIKISGCLFITWAVVLVFHGMGESHDNNSVCRGRGGGWWFQISFGNFTIKTIFIPSLSQNLCTRRFWNTKA